MSLVDMIGYTTKNLKPDASYSPYTWPTEKYTRWVHNLGWHWNLISDIMFNPFSRAFYKTRCFQGGFGDF